MWRETGARGDGNLEGASKKACRLGFYHHVRNTFPEYLNGVNFELILKATTKKPIRPLHPN